MRLRGSCVAAASATVSVAAHALAGGTDFPGSAAIMLLIAASSVTGVVAAHTRTGPLGVMGLLALGQLLGHTALSVPAHCRTDLFTVPMLIAHLVAIVAAALLIRGAETTLLRAVSRIRRAIHRSLRAPGCRDVVTIVSAPEAIAPHRRLVLASGTGRRGPPGAAGSFAGPYLAGLSRA